MDTVIDFAFDHAFPAPVAPTTVECFVRQDAQASVRVGAFPLGSKIVIDKEFELCVLPTL